MLPTVRLLLSYHYFGSVDLCELVNNYAGKVEVFADSGAFSALTTGAVIKFADYAAWLRQWGSLLTVKSSLDVIGDAAESRVNFERLREAGLPVIPVFHVGSDLVELKRLCAEHDYVALGGMVTRVSPFFPWVSPRLGLRRRGAELHLGPRAVWWPGAPPPWRAGWSSVSAS